MKILSPIFKKFLQLLFLTSVLSTQAQVSITGPTCVIAGGTLGYQYTISGSYTASSAIQWCVSGGIIAATGGTCRSGTIASLGPSTRIIWTPGVTNGSLQVTVSGLGSSTKNVTIITVPNTASPSSQLVNFNQSFTINGGGPNSTACAPSGAYRWESSNSPSGPFTAISGTAGSGQNYSSTANFTTITYYRRKLTFNGSDVVYTNVVSVDLLAFSAGSISSTPPSINYNTKPIITQTPASGGTCGSYTYEWQQSVEGGPWTVIGTGVAYPGVAPNLTGNTRIRRSDSCGNQVLFSNTLLFTINYASANAENRNYIRANDVHKKGITSWIEADQLVVGDKQQGTTYYDGLGRPIQTVSMRSSPSQYDIVVPVEYDDNARETKKYLPYRAATQDGKFKTTALGDQNIFLISGSTPFYPGETKPYSESLIENSPLNRVLKTFAPGNNWGGSNRGVENRYQINTTADEVKRWIIASAPGSVPATSSEYGSGELYKNSTIDEDGHQLMEYKDKEGRVVLKKVQLADAPSTGHNGWLCTYYVYDEMRNLRFVIPPKAIVNITTNVPVGQTPWVLNADMVNELCFRYEYDHRGRIIIKKIPGADEVHMVYDARDRLVLTQDGNQRQMGRWFYTLYDELNRLLATGLWTNSSNRVILQSQAANSTNYPLYSPSDPNYEELTRNFYDDYTWITGTGLTATLDNSSINSANFITTYNTSPDYAQPITQFDETKSVVTGVKVKVLNSTMYLYTLNIYDERMRLIQVKSQNHTGGTDITTNQYDFSGKLIRSFLSHTKGGTNSQTHTVSTKTKYDHTGRLTELKKNINSLGDKTIAKNNYDELGQLSSKQLGTHPINTTIPLEIINYEYNIRGWLKAINKNYVEGEGNATSNFFGEVLKYDFGYSKQFYNGNISAINWKSRTDATMRRYLFDYDNSNRITRAEFAQRNPNSSGYDAAWTKDKVDFTVSNLQYDANGNILTMQQYGVKITTPQLIDNLTYTYINNTNKLYSINDAVGGANKLGDFTDGPNSFPLEYSYDPNGSLISDDNNGGFPKYIFYNHLNLSETIYVIEKGNINYTYDAAGSKLSKLTVDETQTPAITTRTDYVSSFVYENDNLQFALHEEGRIRFVPPVGTIPAAFVYDYFIKDHLGSVRMVITEEQQQQTYPAATLEDPPQSLDEEKKYYSINTGDMVNKSQVPGITDYQNNNGNPPYNTNPYVNTTANSQKLYKLNGSGTRNGLGITLKVMAGDRVDIFGKSYFYLGGGTVLGGTTPVSIASLLADFAGSFAVNTFGKGATGTGLNGTPSVTGPLNGFLGTQPGPTSTTPKAFINWILFDEQFNPVVSSLHTNSGFDRVGPSEGIVRDHMRTTGEITRSGYLYVYCSNESPMNVYFDNLQVIHTRGQILEDDHYYPFGLAMEGISLKSAEKLDNKYKYNGQERQNDLEGNWYQYRWRNYDPQTGRFFCIDPLASKYEYLTPYQFASNDPISMREIEGLEGIKFQEIDENGKFIRHVIQQKVLVVVVDKWDKKGTGKKEPKNRVESTYTMDDVKTVREILNTMFNGNEGKGATNSKGETVFFDFDVEAFRIGSQDATTEAELISIGAHQFATESSDVIYTDENTKEKIYKKSPANILLGGGFAGVYAEGANNGIRTRLSDGKQLDPDVNLHEMLHQLITRPGEKEHALGGGLATPPQGLNTRNVNAALQDALTSKVPIIKRR